ncbi:hypothetical protein [Mesorhizobium sp. WSM1293]|uniref:hypothetical protein n=1 Tax=Mesorhizobium sp. WSM1293 TaxID=1040984 RepID=UPI000484E0DA|nr:hypothetical protein [Mesorhizobium sp. WSM1293]
MSHRPGGRTPGSEPRERQAGSQPYRRRSERTYKDVRNRDERERCDRGRLDLIALKRTQE